MSEDGRWDARRFYIYTHARPDGAIFYVGKGCGDRSRDFYNRSEHHKRVVNKYGAKNIQIRSYVVRDEHHAYVIERQLILAMRKAGVALINRDNGGRTRTGVVIHPEHREKIRLALIGHPVSAEARAKISAAGKGRVPSAATRAKYAAKKLSESHKEALLRATTGRVVSEESRAKAREKMLGRKLTEEHRQKLRDAKLGTKHAPETFEKRSLALRAAWARRKQVLQESNHEA